MKRLRGKVMTMDDVRRLKGQALPATHLARYEAAHDAGKACVLDVPCVECGAAISIQCLGGS